MSAYTAAGRELPDAAALAADLAFRQRWEAKVVKDSVSGCWLFCGARDEKGYGRLYLRLAGGRSSTVYAAHRIAFALANGRWPSSALMVLHSCDTPACVNPDHLREGSAQDNQNDIDERGRRRPYRRPGADHWRDGRPSDAIMRGGSPLSPDSVRAVRRKVAAAGGAEAAKRDGETLLLALEHGTSEASIVAVITRRTFAWVIPGGGRH